MSESIKTWTPQQDEALINVRRWLQNRDKPFFYLAGYAGTGKTTLAKHLVQDVSGLVLFGAYTGKAAHVLHKKGCSGATTIHRMIYQPKIKTIMKLKELEDYLKTLREGTREWSEVSKKIKIERLELRKPAFTINFDGPASLASLIVIDECSMVGVDMGLDLLSFGKPILVIGDPGQLPPVKGTGYFTNQKPDVMLTDIVRQAKENPIIDLATRVREGQQLKKGRYFGTLEETGEELLSEVVDMSNISDPWERSHDQILCGRNRTRKQINFKIRRYDGRTSFYPEQGDKLVCLRNDYDIGLLNGSQWIAKKSSERVNDEQITMNLQSDDDKDKTEPVECIAWSQYFDGDPEDIPYTEIRKAQEFDYGYAMTVHKSQGSQWDNVLLYDESYCFTSNRKEWLYTGITRAAKNITIGV